MTVAAAAAAGAGLQQPAERVCGPHAADHPGEKPFHPGDQDHETMRKEGWQVEGGEGGGGGGRRREWRNRQTEKREREKDGLTERREGNREERKRDQLSKRERDQLAERRTREADREGGGG